MTLEQVLQWLSGPDGGAFLVIAWAAAWGLEKFKFWQEIDNKELKSLVILTLASFLGVGAVGLQTNPQLVATLEPYFRPVMYAIMTWLATQTGHELNPFRKRANVNELVESVNSKMSA